MTEGIIEVETIELITIEEDPIPEKTEAETETTEIEEEWVIVDQILDKMEEIDSLEMIDLREKLVLAEATPDLTAEVCLKEETLEKQVTEKNIFFKSYVFCIDFKI